MLEIIAVKLAGDIDASMYERMLSFVSDAKRESVNKFYRREDALRSLTADILTRSVISRKTGLKKCDLSFEKNEYGKPFLKCAPYIHFNLSHAGEWVVCAVSDYEVGIDIEKIKPTDFSVAKRFFSPEEYQDLMLKSAEERLAFFYDLWTLKESYIKSVGKGLYLPLDDFSFTLENGKVAFMSKIEIGACSFKQYSIDEGYKLSVCVLGNINNDKLIIQTLDEILR